MMGFSQHVIIITVVSIIFICFLVHGSIRSSCFHREFRRATKRLLDQTRQAEGRAIPKWEQIPHWLAPFVGAFRNSFHLTQARESTSRHLEERLATQIDYLKLQKLQTAAPLIGVVLTATGFITMESDFEDLRSLSIPLVGGVASGAVLALLSQLVIFFVELDIDKSREDAQFLIDDIWLKAIAEMEDPHCSILVAVEKLEHATTSLTDSIGNFPRDIPALTQRFGQVYDLSNKTFVALAEVAPQLKEMSSDWRKATSVIAESTEKELWPSHKLLSEGIRQLHTVSTGLSAIIGQLQNIGTGLSVACSEQQLLHTRLVATTKEQADDNRQKLSDQAQEFQDTQKQLILIMTDKINLLLNELSSTVTRHLNAIKDGTDEIKEPLQATAAFLSATAPSIQSSADFLSIIGKASKDFSETVSQTIIPSYKNLKLFESSAQEMQVAIRRLGKSLDEVSTASKAGQEFSEVIRMRALPTVEVLQRATGSFEDSVTLMAECTRELTAVLATLARVSIDSPIQRISPND